MNGAWLKSLSITLAIAALVACGGSGDQTAGIDRGGAPTPVAVVGPITGFGSIVVNGVHYAVDHAAVEVDGDPANAADLALGQIVTILGERDADGVTGAADDVSFQTNVRGPIDSLDLTASRLTVLQQTVAVGSSTVFALGTKPASLASLQLGDLVTISGFVNAQGMILATRIESVSASRGLLVLGVVSNLNAAVFHFNIGKLVVDYRQAVLIDGFASGAPSDGDRVTVKGTTVAQDGALLAVEVHRAREIGGPAGSDSDIEGLITRFVSPSDFDVAGRPVTTTAATQYAGGAASDLALNARVEVAGTSGANGVIVANRIEFDD